MALLQVSDFPGKHRDFEILLQDETESPTIRQLAVMKLWRINTPESVNILLNNTHINDNRVLAAIVTSLGRIGGKSALKALAEIANRRTDSLLSS
jgi:HEAT repeat protein